jgi:hypothetical protein
MSDQKPNLDALIRKGSAVTAPKEDAAAKPSATSANAIDFSSIGGRKIGHFVPETSEKEIDFSSIGGRKIGQFRLEEPTEPAESVEKEDDAHQ